MRHNSRRPKNNRNNNNNGGNNNGRKPSRTQVYDSNGPDVRIRGTAHQVHEKYTALAKDARSSGDWIMSENYLQHAEHYQRLINEVMENTNERSNNNNNNAQNNKQQNQNQTENQSQNQNQNQSQSQPNNKPSKATNTKSKPNTDNAADNKGNSIDEEDDLGLPASMLKPVIEISDNKDELENA